MENQIFGIVTIILSLGGFTLACRQFKNHKTLSAVIFLMICGLFLRFYAATDLYLHEWDERYHALVAKNMIEHPFRPTLYEDPVLPYNYKNWAANHIWVHKQPFPLWTMALSMSVLGINEIALRLPSILLSTLGIWITFAIGRYLFNSRVGFIAAFLYAIHGLIIELTAGRVATDHIDVFFLFFIQLAVFLGIRFMQTEKPVYNIFCGISIGIAILSKWLPALIVLPIWLLLVLDSKKFSLKQTILQFVLLCIVTTAVFLPWQLYIHKAFPQEARWESSYNFKHLTGVLDEQGGSFFYHFNKLRIIFGELVYLPVIWFLWKSFKKWRNYRRLLITIWFLVPFLFFSFAATKMQAYTLFTAPAIFIITALFFHYVYYYRQRIGHQWLTWPVMALLLILPVRYSVERIKPFQQRERHPEWVKELKALNRSIDDRSKVIVFNADHPVETMFYVNCTAYPDLPGRQVLEGLTGSGYTLLINDRGDLPAGTDRLPNVKIIKLPG
ncbi:MAG: glycosyltransferase family 39 protein [Bacteroidales bacterium]|nr:glycosyltransferase family 39 protein [Bacteroidales bacterium]MBN2699622.1 glycosyltransferase family 39 protein [Bacteroidales bacterium]